MAPAMAATITYSFNGTVNLVGNQVTPATLPTPPSTMTGSITVNTTDNTGMANRGAYTIENFQVTFGGGYTASFIPGNSSGVVDIRNGNGMNPNADQFNVAVSSPTGNIVNFMLHGCLRLTWVDQRIFLRSDALPNPAPSIGSFTGSHDFRIQFGPGNADIRAVQGVLTSLTAVPLPAAVILFGAVLVALIGLGAGGLRNLRMPQV